MRLVWLLLSVRVACVWLLALAGRSVALAEKAAQLAEVDHRERTSTTQAAVAHAHHQRAAHALTVDRVRWSPPAASPLLLTSCRSLSLQVVSRRRASAAGARSTRRPASERATSADDDQADTST
jgi:hypothetical protein